MRALVLLLLLANLLFAAWVHWVAPSRAPVAGRATPSATDPGAIRLLREAQVPSSVDAGGSALELNAASSWSIRDSTGLSPRRRSASSGTSGSAGGD